MEEKLENWVILLDCTKSMSNEDFQPNRFQTALSGLKLFFENKYKAFQKIRASIIIFSTKVSIISEFTDDIPSLISLIRLISKKKFKKQYIPEGSSFIMDNALSKAIDILAQQIQNISGFKNCILLISDNDNIEISEKNQDKIMGLKISLNIITFSQEKKIIVENHHFKFQHFNTKQAFLDGMKNLASLDKKEKNKAQNFSELIEQKKKKHDFMEEIALSLRNPSSEELIKFKKKSNKIHCQICSSKISPIKKYSLYNTGRLCSHCGTPMHLHCAGLWALKSSEHKNLFRCPYCYSLLKIPVAILNGLNINTKKKESLVSKKLYVKMITIKPEKLKQKTQDCLKCFNPIRAPHSQNVFQCSNCKAYFHKKCLEEMYKIDKKCLNCGGLIV